jgi:hypothetical protein
MNVIDYITITCNINKNGRLQITSDYMIKYNQLQLITITNYRCKVAYFHAMKKGQVANFHGPCNEGMRGS